MKTLVLKNNDLSVENGSIAFSGGVIGLENRINQFLNFWKNSYYLNKDGIPYFSSTLETRDIVGIMNNKLTNNFANEITKLDTKSKVSEDVITIEFTISSIYGIITISNDIDRG